MNDFEVIGQPVEYYGECHAAFVGLHPCKPFQWWGTALFVAVQAFVRRRQLDDDRRREHVRNIDAIVTQARYLHALRGEWPTAISMPLAPPMPTVRVPVYPKESGLFADAKMAVKFEFRDIRVGMVRNSDGFWSAQFAGSRDPVMFWPAPREAPEWWDAR